MKPDDPYYDDGNPYAPPPLGDLEEKQPGVWTEQKLRYLRRARWWLMGGFLAVFSFFLFIWLPASWSSLLENTGISNPAQKDATGVFVFYVVSFIIVPLCAILETTYWLRYHPLLRLFYAWICILPFFSILILWILLIHTNNIIDAKTAKPPDDF